MRKSHVNMATMVAAALLVTSMSGAAEGLKQFQEIAASGNQP